MGGESSLQVIKDGLAKGADRAIFINTNNLDNLSILDIGKIMANKFKEENFDMIFSGLQSDDNGNGQLGLILAELLNMSHGSLIMGTKLNDTSYIKVKQELENGWFQWMNLDLPTSISIQSGINTPRYSSLKGIMSVKKKTIDSFFKTQTSSSDFMQLSIQ